MYEQRTRDSSDEQTISSGQHASGLSGQCADDWRSDRITLIAYAASLVAFIGIAIGLGTFNYLQSDARTRTPTSHPQIQSLLVPDWRTHNLPTDPVRSTNPDPDPTPVVDQHPTPSVAQPDPTDQALVPTVVPDPPDPPDPPAPTPTVPVDETLGASAPQPAPTQPNIHAYAPSGCPQLIIDYFTPYGTAAAACSVSYCESTWNPNATGSQGEMGWFQIHPRWHADATYDPVGNILAAIRISAGGTNWGAWTCRP